VQPGLFTRIKVSHINVGVQPAFLTDSLARLFTRYSPCFCTEQAGAPGAAPGVGAGYGGRPVLNRAWFIIMNFPTFLCTPFRIS
jgi:hypothetical protein